jgi:tRNA (guanine37-N1)-methyltransferase
MQHDIFRIWRNVAASGQATISRQYIGEKKYYLYAHRPSLFQKLACKCVEFCKFDRSSMAKSDSNLDPPENVRGMKVLDRSLFRKTVSIPGLAVPHKSVTKLTKSLKNEILRFRSIQPVVDLNVQDKLSKSHKLVLFDPLKIKTVNDFNEKQKCILETLETEMNSFCLYNFDMKYENWGHAEVIKAVLPKEFETVAGFAIVGHIAHLNLREGTEDYKQLIGKEQGQYSMKMSFGSNSMNSFSTF